MRSIFIGTEQDARFLYQIHRAAHRAQHAMLYIEDRVDRCAAPISMLLSSGAIAIGFALQ